MSWKIPNRHEFAFALITQACADLEIAYASVWSDFEGMYRPFHAALTKCQQAIEKSLKGIVVLYDGTNFFDPFGRHNILHEMISTQKKLPRDLRNFVATITPLRRKKLLDDLLAISRLAPDREAVEVDEETLVVKKIHPNTEYPFGDPNDAASIVSPASAFADRGVSTGAVKSVVFFFDHLGRNEPRTLTKMLGEFAEYMRQLSDKAR